MRTTQALATSTAISIVAFALGWWLLTAWEYRWYSGIIPAEIGLEDAIEISGHGLIREGCGAAIFRMDERTAHHLSTEGLDFLATAKKSRDHDDSYHTFRAWHATPKAQQVELAGISGLGCSSADEALSREIDAALLTQGAYFSSGPEKTIVLIPDKKLVVLSYQG